MRDYDAVFIFQTAEEKYKTGLDVVKNEFSTRGISIKNENDLGVKDLAYEIKKHKQGHYVQFEIESVPNVVFQMDTAFHLNDEILKYLFINKSK